jgi:hypothetical protein
VPAEAASGAAVSTIRERQSAAHPDRMANGCISRVANRKAADRAGRVQLIDASGERFWP